jgi:hypothetical protein
MLQEDCECKEREMKKWKQNWDEVFIFDVEREREGKKRERREKEGKERGKMS